MGTPDFAVPSFNLIAESNHEIISVFTQPDRSKGRHSKLSFPPVKEAAIRRNIDVIQPQRISRDKDAINYIKKESPDLIVVVAYGHILSDEILKVPKYGCINLHASLLPKYRGASPIQGAILAGDEETGVTIMELDSGVDTGDILSQKKVRIEDRNAVELSEKLAQVGAILLLETIDELEEGSVVPKKQDEDSATHVDMISKSDGEVNFEKDSALDIERKLRAYYEWPGIYLEREKGNIKIKDGYVIRNKFTEEVEQKPGKVLNTSNEGIDVICRNGVFRIKSIQMSGKKALSAKDFLLGHRVKKGDYFL